MVSRISEVGKITIICNPRVRDTIGLTVTFHAGIEIFEYEVEDLVAVKLQKPLSSKTKRAMTTKQILKTSWIDMSLQSSLSAKTKAELLAQELSLPYAKAAPRYQTAMIARVEDLEFTLDSGAGRHLVSLRDARLLNAEIVTAKELINS